GTGASTHSWGGLVPALAEHFTVVAPDLPGHAFTGALPSERMSLSGMSTCVAALLRHVQVDPSIVVGHSAGVAIAVWMSLEQLITPAGLVSLNGALLPI